MEQQILRALPKIRFGKDLFYVETRLWEFRQHDHPGNTISFDALDSMFDGSFLLYYDHKVKNVYQGDFPLPVHISVYRIPELQLLDPVGLSRKGSFFTDRKEPEDTYIRNRKRWFDASDNEIKEEYEITVPIKRARPEFGEYDLRLMQAKLKRSS